MTFGILLLVIAVVAFVLGCIADSSSLVGLAIALFFCTGLLYAITPEEFNKPLGQMLHEEVTGQ